VWNLDAVEEAGAGWVPLIHAARQRYPATHHTSLSALSLSRPLSLSLVMHHTSLSALSAPYHFLFLAGSPSSMRHASATLPDTTRHSPQGRPPCGSLESQHGVNLRSDNGSNSIGVTRAIIRRLSTYARKLTPEAHPGVLLCHTPHVTLHSVSRSLSPSLSLFLSLSLSLSLARSLSLYLSRSLDLPPPPPHTHSLSRHTPQVTLRTVVE